LGAKEKGAEAGDRCRLGDATREKTTDIRGEKGGKADGLKF